MINLLCHLRTEVSILGRSLSNMGKEDDELKCFRSDWTVQRAPCLIAPTTAQSWAWQASLTSTGYLLWLWPWQALGVGLRHLGPISAESNNGA